MSVMTSHITSLTIVYSSVYSGADQRKHQSCASLAFVWGIHRWPGNSPRKGPVTRKMFPFDDVIMYCRFLPPIPINVFRSNSKFDKNLLCSGLKYAQLISMKFCTHHDSYTVVTCAKFHCDWLNKLWTKVLQIFIQFQIWLKYIWWDGHQVFLFIFNQPKSFQVPLVNRLS